MIIDSHRGGLKAVLDQEKHEKDSSDVKNNRLPADGTISEQFDVFSIFLLDDLFPSW